MQKEKKETIHPHPDYFTAKKAASDWFAVAHSHECGTVFDTKRETPEGLYISFRSRQDEIFPERYLVLIINQNVEVKCAVRKDTKVSPQQIAP